MLEDDAGDGGDQVREQAAEDGGGEREVLLERQQQAEGQRLAGQQVGPEPVGLDEGADLAVGDLAAHERHQGGVDDVEAAGGPARREAAAEAAQDAVAVGDRAAGIAARLAPEALLQAGGGAEAGVEGLGAVVLAQQQLAGRRSRVGAGLKHGMSQGW